MNKTIVAIVLFTTFTAHAQYYKWRGDDGAWHFGIQPPPNVLVETRQEVTYKEPDRSEIESDKQNCSKLHGALLMLKAATTSGVSYIDYGGYVTEAEHQWQILVRKKTIASGYLRESMDYYQKAKELWTICITRRYDLADEIANWYLNKHAIDTGIYAHCANGKNLMWERAEKILTKYENY